MQLIMLPKIGKKEGKKEEKNEIAKEMLKRGLPVDLICDITKLTKKEVENIMNNSKN